MCPAVWPGTSSDLGSRRPSSVQPRPGRRRASGCASPPAPRLAGRARRRARIVPLPAARPRRPYVVGVVMGDRGWPRAVWPAAVERRPGPACGVAGDPRPRHAPGRPPVPLYQPEVVVGECAYGRDFKHAADSSGCSPARSTTYVTPSPACRTRRRDLRVVRERLSLGHVPRTCLTGRLAGLSGGDGRFATPSARRFRPNLAGCSAPISSR